MKLFPIETGNFKLDGGAMFGVVPKSIWSRTNPADPNNKCSFAMRSLLIQDEDRLILIDTGLGNKQSEKFFSYYDLHGEANLVQSIRNAGFHPDEITDVVLSHLHFDHVGGAGYWNKDRTLVEMQFKNARYWSNKNHWQWATNPNAREKASFLTENILPIEASGQLNFITEGNELGENMSFLMVDGHTEKQMIPHIKYKGTTVVFMADLLPTIGHIPLPYVMSYDVRPLITLEEKTQFLNAAQHNNYCLFLQHDAYHECCTLKETDRGIKLENTYKLSEL